MTKEPLTHEERLTNWHNRLHDQGHWLPLLDRLPGGILSSEDEKALREIAAEADRLRAEISALTRQRTPFVRALRASVTAVWTAEEINAVKPKTKGQIAEDKNEAYCLWFSSLITDAQEPPTADEIKKPTADL